MKEESGRILKRSVLSVMVAAALYSSQVMAFTQDVWWANSEWGNCGERCPERLE